MNLYEINFEIANLIANSVNEEGEFNKDVFNDLDQLKIEKKEKALDCARVIKNITAECDAISNEINQLSIRKKQKTVVIDSIKKYLSSTIDGEKLEDATCVISWRKSSSVIIDDETILPEKYFRIIPEEKQPDKNLIKQELKSGEIPGAHLEDKNNIQIK